MKFDAERFKATTFEDRTKAVPVPQLKSFFVVDDDSKEADQPVWIVRGLTGIESARVRQAIADSKNLESVIEALGVGTLKEKVEAIRKVAGLETDEDVPEDIVRRYSSLTQASIDPVCDYPLAIALAKNHPEVFYLLTNTIISLTSGGRLGE